MLKGAKPEEFKDLGFGTKITSKEGRIINKDGSFNVERKGFSHFDFYQWLIGISWWKFIFIVFITYFIVNIVFAVFYFIIGVEYLSGIEGSTNFEKFYDAFFFSAQSLTTVGYGRISPIGFYASIIASIESMAGLLGFALATGLMYGRFSRPAAKFIYSDKSIIAPYQEIKGFMIRIANARKNQLIEVEAQVAMTWVDKEKKLRQFEMLKLERSKINFLAMSWTLVHPIDESSPLYNMNKENLEEKKVEFIVLLKAFDESFSQTVYSRNSYLYSEVEWGAKFILAISDNGDGKALLDIDKISLYEKV